MKWINAYSFLFGGNWTIKSFVFLWVLCHNNLQCGMRFFVLAAAEYVLWCGHNWGIFRCYIPKKVEEHKMPKWMRLNYSSLHNWNIYNGRDSWIPIGYLNFLEFIFYFTYIQVCNIIAQRQTSNFHPSIHQFSNTLIYCKGERSGYLFNKGIEANLFSFRQKNLLFQKSFTMSYTN